MKHRELSQIAYSFGYEVHSDIQTNQTFLKCKHHYRPNVYLRYTDIKYKTAHEFAQYLGSDLKWPTTQEMFDAMSPVDQTYFKLMGNEIFKPYKDPTPKEVAMFAFNKIKNWFK